MADSFQVVTSYEDVEFLGGTNTRDVLVTGIRTNPSGIYIEVRVPMAEFRQYGSQVVNAAALSWTTIYETLAKQPYVAGVQWAQEVVKGNLADVAIITVESESGDSQASLTVPIASLGPKLDAAAIKSLHDKLTATEQL